MRRSRAKEPKTRPCTSSRSVEVIGTVAFQVGDLRQVYRVDQHQTGQEPAMMARASRTRKVMLPASFMGPTASGTTRRTKAGSARRWSLPNQ